MITIRRYYQTAAAGLAQSRLESDGIAAALADEGVFALGGQYAPWGIRLEVPDEEEERAREILARQEEPDPLPEHFVPPETSTPEAVGTAGTRPEGSDLRAAREAMIWLAILSVAGWLALERPPVDDDYAVVPKVGEQSMMDITIYYRSGAWARGWLLERCAGKVERNGQSYTQLFETSWGPSLPRRDHTLLVRKDATGLYRLDDRTVNAVEEPRLSFPLTVGKKWSWASFTAGRVETTVKSYESLEIDRAFYAQCLHLVTVAKSNSFYEEVWYAPRIGCVRAGIRYPSGTRISYAAHNNQLRHQPLGAGGF